MKERDQMCTVTLDGNSIDVPFNTTVLELFKDHYEESEFKSKIAALLNNRLYGLTTPIRANYNIVSVTRNDRMGMTVYRRSVSLLLREAVNRLYPGARVIIGQSIQDGYFFNITEYAEGVSKAMIENIEEEMRRMVEEDLPFKVESHFVDDVTKHLREEGSEAKANLLQIHWWPQVRLVKCGGTVDLFHDPYVPSTGYCKLFAVAPYWPGMVLRFPAQDKDVIPGKIGQLPTLFNTYMESRQWNQMLGVENLGQLNGAVLNGEVEHIIKVAEGLHEKKIASIADTIAGRQPDIGLVIIAGPSSSGKTTFSKRLAVQLMVNGIRPKTLEMDNFFVERDQTPRDEKGDFDFESIDAIDIELFNDVLVKLMEGQTALTPIFDFKKGGKVPQDKWIPMKLEKDQVLIIEGIHGLNERLTQNVLGHRMYKIFVS
ncbi:nucleoside kinase, partial [Myxococcota bacterium]|nr:nucleoside kinase [Myxococcota bacterium]